MSRAAAPMLAAAATPTGQEVKCGYATGGEWASRLCWLDFSSVLGTADPTTPVASTTSPLTKQIYIYVGAYTLTATLTITPVNAAGGYVYAHTFPTWKNAYLGNNGFYTEPKLADGTVIAPVVYQGTRANAGQTKISLSDVQLTDSTGKVLTDYQLLVADGESTNTSEWINWTTQNSTGFKLLKNSSTSAYGNGCTAALGNAFANGPRRAQRGAMAPPLAC